jgi:ATP synthase protein I
VVDRNPRNKSSHPEKHFSREVGRSARRKLRARETEERRSAWFWLGMFGLVGWSVAVPTLVGVAIGIWIDRTWPSEISWTLTLLFVGVALGSLNAWHWVRQEMRQE